MIPFNKPFLTGKETHYIYQAVETGTLSGNGKFTKQCQHFLEERYNFKKCLLTTSGTDALEMCAMLCDLKPGDEVIVPSYTFVSTALAFLREGAKVVFVDSGKDNPNINPKKIEELITPRTKVIVPVHYAGIACDMDAIMDIAKRHNLLVVEDAAQAIDSYYVASGNNFIADGKYPLGSIGHLAAFSFHETKNIISGEGGLLAINDERFIRRAEIIWEKGTNRAEFYRGVVNKYGWVDMGSSFLPSEVIAAFLWAQLENLDIIQTKRKKLWNRYYELLQPLAKKGCFSLPNLPKYATNNAHMFYLTFQDLNKRSAFIQYMKEHDVQTVFHYLSLHSSKYYEDKHDGRVLPECDRYADTLVRLPMYYDLTIEDVNKICELIVEYYAKN